MAAVADREERAKVIRILSGVALALAFWALSTATWGLPGFYMPAVFVVPVMVLILIRLTRP